MGKSDKASAFTLGGFAIAGGGWVMMQVMPQAPAYVIVVVGFCSLAMLTMAFHFYFLPRPKPKPEFVALLREEIIKGDALQKEEVNDSIDRILFQKSVKDWINGIQEILKQEIHDDDVGAFDLITPFILDGENEDVCKQAVGNRLNGLQAINARYLNGENVKK